MGQGQPGGALYVVLQGSVAPHQRRRESVGNATERGGQGGDALQAGDAFGEDAMLHADG